MLVMEWKWLKCVVLIITVKCHGCTQFEGNNLSSHNRINNLFNYIQKVKPKEMPALTVSEEFNARSINEDINLNITQLFQKYGYGVEEHQVTTSDGYILDIFRVPGNGPVVFIMHGLICSSDDFVSTGPEHGLPYLLADLGYDVWLGNARGNKHGRKHVTMSPNSAEFWEFSFDEIGRYDLTAMIDYVLEETNQRKLVYIGHSQGTTSFFVMTSEYPEYNDKISVMIALSAVAYLSHQRNVLLTSLSTIYKPLYVIGQNIGLYEILADNETTKAFTSTFCGTPTLAYIICNNLLFLVFGPDYAQINATVLPVIYGHFPGGAALKQFAHYGQEIITGKFNQFDRGFVGNINKYGTPVPPDYYLEKVTSKVVILYSDNDYLSTAQDRSKLTARLPNVIGNYRIPFAKFSHSDFIFAKDVRKLVYYKVVEILNNNT
ncbi:lipase 3-like [Plodia interpunctella]|uniref:lipase 3-like n=1 Tax=Plodia interpunctella TaxID=58824 RepID=UPI0023679749|nr:lipase 3-like [Plodia interpunctella]